MRPITLLSSALAVAAPLNAIAQEPPLVEPGQRVRVTVNALAMYKLGWYQYDGTFRRIHRDTLTIDSLSVPWISVTSLEVHDGRKRNAGPGALVGGFIGGLSVGAIGVAICSDLDCDAGGVAAIGFVVGALPGALLGAGIGAVLKTDRWEQVPPDRLHVSFVPQRDGRFTLGTSISF